MSKEEKLLKIINELDNEKAFKNELRMHKILYFLYGFYWKEHKEKLFDSKFSAWQYGPVELDYRHLTNLSKFNISYEKKKNIEKIWSKYITFFNLENNDLISYSHITKPWINSSKKERGNNQINEKNIQDYFLETNDFLNWDKNYVFQKTIKNLIEDKK